MDLTQFNIDESGGLRPSPPMLVDPASRQSLDVCIVCMLDIQTFCYLANCGSFGSPVTGTDATGVICFLPKVLTSQWKVLAHKVTKP